MAELKWRTTQKEEGKKRGEAGADAFSYRSMALLASSLIRVHISIRVQDGAMLDKLFAKRRPARLGVGAKFIPHDQVEDSFREHTIGWVQTSKLNLPCR